MNTALLSMDVDAGSEIERTAPRRAGSAWRRVSVQIASILVIGACVIGGLWLIISVVVEAERHAAIEHARSETNNLSAAFQAEVEGKLDAVVRSMDFIASRMRSDGHFDIYS